MLYAYGKRNFQDGNYKYAGIDEFTGLIMEESVEGTIMSKLKSYNIDIYC